MTEMPLIQSEFSPTKAILFGLLAFAGCILVALHDPTPAPTPAPMDLTGRWVIDYSFSNVIRDQKSLSLAEHGSVCLIQHGDELTGSGLDQFGEGPEQFQITGNVSDSDRVTLSKAYRLLDPQSGKEIPDKPISLQAKLVSKPGQPVEMEGIWSKKEVYGHFLNHHVITYRGEFRAHRIAEMEQPSESWLSPVDRKQLPGTTL